MNKTICSLPHQVEVLGHERSRKERKATLLNYNKELSDSGLQVSLSLGLITPCPSSAVLVPTSWVDFHVGAPGKLTCHKTLTHLTTNVQKDA